MDDDWPDQTADELILRAMLEDHAAIITDSDAARTAHKDLAAQLRWAADRKRLREM